LNNPSALISGAGVAGPALAFWLNRCGVALHTWRLTA
jgi:2-polyprenyl-6-methoxyphenol hydroxylase-like FAD-dependent oxidoreductase